VLATRSALAADGALLEPAERAEIERLVGEIESLVAEGARGAEGSDAHAIEAATKALAEGTEAFAALRMNQSIRTALAGKRLEEV
jgi:molecular chaperone HscA